MKNLKKLLCLAITTFIVLSIAVVPTMAKNSYSVGTTSESLKVAEEILFYEDFNSLNAGTTVAVNDLFGNTAYTQLYVKSADGAVSVVGDGADKYLSVSGVGNTKGKFRLMSTPTDVFTGKYVTEFKFMIPDDNAEADCTIFSNMGGIGATSKEYYGARVKYYGNNKLQVFNGSTGSYVADNKILQGAWYNVKVITDIDNNNWTMYLNGNPIFINKQLHSINTADNMLTPFFATNFKGTIYYDDIFMYREPVGRVTYSAEDFSGYGAERDWSTFENTAFVGANYLPSSYSATSVDAYDTWLQGLNISPAKVLTNGKIANGKMQLGGTGKQSVVLLNDYDDNHQISQDMSVSFTFNTTDASKNHDEIYRMREHNANTNGIRLQLNQRNLIADNDSVSNTILLSGIEDNRDYRITVVSDFSEKTYSIYVDGVCLGTGLTHKEYTGSSTYANNGRPFEILLASTTPTCYYDDLVIYTDVREDVMTQAMAAAKANSAAVSAGASSFSLPASTTAGYTVSWASDNAAITVENGTATVAYGEQSQKVTLTATVADSANGYAIERKLVVNVPAKYSVIIAEDNGVVSGAVIVNELAADGYNNGKAVLAVYKGGEMVACRMADVENGQASIVLDEIAEIGNYKARLYLWEKGSFKPIKDNVSQIEFSID